MLHQTGLYYLVTVPPILTCKNFAMSGQINASSGVSFKANDPSDTATTMSCGLYLEEVGDNLSGAGNFAYYRWWSHSARVTLQNGVFSGSTSFDNLSDWSSIFGEYATQTTVDANIGGGKPTQSPHQGFAAALANPAWIGITCGGFFFGHGVYATGPATFTMNSFSIQ
jgi:hypothetical protein